LGHAEQACSLPLIHRLPLAVLAVLAVLGGVYPAT